LQGSPATSPGWVVRTSILAATVMFLLAISGASNRFLPHPAVRV
jgi:hypothetical protein